MSAILIIGLLLVVIVLYAASQPEGSTKVYPSFREGLPRNPTKQQLIAHGEKFWSGRKLPLRAFGEITACVGRSTYVWRDGNGNAHIICHACARRLAAKVYPNHVQPVATSVGMVHGVSPLDMALLTLKMMWIGANYATILSRRGRPQGIYQNLEDIYACEECAQDVCLAS